MSTWRPTVAPPWPIVVAVPARCDRCGIAPDLTQICGTCGRRLCSDCYRPWSALTCPGCRTKGRTL